MTKQEIALLTKEYPETPRWIIEQGKTLQEAEELMALRRFAFPKTWRK